MKDSLKKILLLLLCLFSIFSITSCSIEEEEKEKHLVIGMVVGGIFDQYIPDIYPGSNIQYYYSASDLPLALASGKVDVYIDDEFSAIEHCKAYTNQVIDKVIREDSYGFIFNKNNEELRDKMNDFLLEIENDSRLQDIQDKWLEVDENSDITLNYDELTGENGTLKVGIAATMAPFDYVKDNKYLGYEPALIFEFAKEYGYALEFENADFSSTMAAVTSGTCDIGSASYSITEERKKNMLFSNPTMHANCVAVINKSDADNSDNNISNQKIGVVTGALFDVAVKNENPTAQIVYFNYTSDLPIALDNAKIDGYTVDEPVAHLMCNIYDHYIVKKLTEEEYGIAICKDRKELQSQFNEYLSRLKQNGELTKLQDIWFSNDESIKTIDFDALTNNHNVLTYAVAATMQPFDYVKQDNYAGYEIALVANFCKEYGYGLKIEDTNFTGVVAAVSSGKADIGSCVITITDERKQTMNFTDSIYEGGIVLVKKKQNTLDSFSELNGKNIGVQVGSTYDKYIMDGIKDSKVQYYNLISDMSAALDSDKISGFVVDGPVADLFIKENKDKYKVFGNLKDVRYGIVLPKSKDDEKDLYKKLDYYVTKLRETGELNDIYNAWINCDSSSLNGIDVRNLENINGEISLAISSTTGAPFIYIKDGKLCGYEIDIMYRFARDNGYKLNINDYNIDGFYSAVASGKCDVGICGVSITEERQATMNIVDQQIESGCVVVVKNGGAVTKNDSSILDSFYRTFIKEERWRLFISGILTTIIITGLSIIIGTILGFQVYMLNRKLSLRGKKIVEFIRNLIQKTPTVVILMIFYYIIFGRIEISGSLVSIIGLSILFANAVFGLITMGTLSIDKGQMEAATSLGYSRSKAFIEIILPQVIINVASGYKSAVVTLIKESAIVGYIAVQDLTKVGDIIRSRTYEAFFPLIATAVIYYIIASIFIYFANKVEFKINPKNRTSLKVLEGVETDDRN